jgi:hypothetical protein
MVKYRKPPVVERAYAVGAEIDEELFHRKVESWKNLLQKEFPDVETITEWLIRVSEKDGMPTFDPSDQKMAIRHRFWKGGAKNRETGIQVIPGRIAFNLLSSQDNPRHFEELKELSNLWLRRWGGPFWHQCCSRSFVRVCESSFREYCADFYQQRADLH